MSAGELIGILIGVGIVLIPVVKWFINDWAKKSEKLEQMRATRISRIENESQEVRNVVNSLRTTISEHSRQMGVNESRMRQLNEKIDDTIKSLDHYVNNLKAHVTSEVRTQIIQLSKDLKMVRDKKGAQNGQ